MGGAGARDRPTRRQSRDAAERGSLLRRDGALSAAAQGVIAEPDSVRARRCGVSIPASIVEPSKGLAAASANSRI